MGNSGATDEWYLAHSPKLEEPIVAAEKAVLFNDMIRSTRHQWVMVVLVSHSCGECRTGIEHIRCD